MSESKAGFWSRLSFSSTIEGLKETVKRFPYASICSGLLFVLVVLLIADDNFVEAILGGKDNVARLALLLVSGFFWFGASRLIAEGDGKKSLKDWIVTFGGFALIVLFSAFAQAIEWRVFFLLPALVLMVSFAPYVIRPRDDTSFWFYNRVTWFGVAVAFIGSLLMFGGAAAALGSVDYLFGVDIDGETYGYLWAFAACVLGPLYALSWIPKQFEFTSEDCNDPPGLGFILNWILAPLVIVYMAILYAYFIKILVTGDVPQGQLALMITGFGAAGVITYLVGWPCRESGNVMLRAVIKYFFPALIIPVVMQVYAIYVRLAEYGMTEKRYAICLAALWFAFLAIGFTAKRLRLRTVPLSLAVLLLIASWGPWSAYNMSIANQKDRLDHLLSANELLSDNKIVKAKGEVGFEARKDISSIIDYLGDRKQNVYGFELKRYGNDDVYKALGFDYVSKYNRRGDAVSERLNYHYNGKHRNVRHIEGYAYLVDHFHVGERSNERAIALQDRALTLSTSIDGQVIHLLLEQEAIKFDLSALFDDLKKDGIAARKKKYSFLGETEEYGFKFTVRNAYGQKKDGGLVINSADGTLMVKKKAKNPE